MEGLVILVTVPAIYEKYEDQIGRYAFSGYKTWGILYERFDKQCINRALSLILEKNKVS